MTRIRIPGTFLVIALALVGCGPTAPTGSFDVTEPGVYVGAARSCAELGLSDIRCTTLTLRAAAALDTARPNHSPIASRTLHEAGQPPAGVSLEPRTTTVPVIVVFRLQDGSQIAVPTFCPRNPPAGDRGCDPRVR